MCWRWGADVRRAEGTSKGSNTYVLECCVSCRAIDFPASFGNSASTIVGEKNNQIWKKIRLLNKQRTLRCDTMTQWPWRNPAGPACSHQRWPLARGALKPWHAPISNDHLCAFKWIKCSGVQSQPSFQKWQGNISIDLNGDYKIKRQVLNVSLKASLKSVIAKMDSFCAVKKRESCYSLLLLSQATWELHEISEERPNGGKKRSENVEVIGLLINNGFFLVKLKERHIDFLFCCVFMR